MGTQTLNAGLFRKEALPQSPHQCQSAVCMCVRVCVKEPCAGVFTCAEDNSGGRAH